MYIWGSDKRFLVLYSYLSVNSKIDSANVIEEALASGA